MINNNKDIGFIQDISQLDKLRQQAVGQDKSSQKEALKTAAHQFESVFTNMLFKSMRDANESFKSDLFDSQTEAFYRKMLDEQMASDISSSGKLGLADMIVKQLSAAMDGSAVREPDQGQNVFQDAMKRVNAYHQQHQGGALDADQVAHMGETQAPASQQPLREDGFGSPTAFVRKLKPYAEKAARALGVDPSLLLAQAALETGWGEKVIHTAGQNSHNLFNIKADPSWKGEKVASQSLEYDNNIPVMEKSNFRAYGNYQDSFNDYVKFLLAQPRYASALDHQGDTSFIQGIHQAGYATDPDYAEKVLRVQEKIRQMDGV